MQESIAKSRKSSKIINPPQAFSNKKLSIVVPQTKHSDRYLDIQHNKDLMAMITEFSKQGAGTPENDTSMNALQVELRQSKKSPYSKFGIKKASLMSSKGLGVNLDPHHLLDEGLFENSSMSQQTLVNESTVIKQLHSNQFNESKDTEVVLPHAGESGAQDSTTILERENIAEKQTTSKIA